MIIKFISKDNKDKHKKIVLGWLEHDFNLQGEPKFHFWHNHATIAEAFENGCAMVALDDQEKFIGYMVWTCQNNSTICEIDIVEVKKHSRNQGVFKAMIAALQEKYPQVLILTASVIPQSTEIFKKMGWAIANSSHGSLTSYFKIISPILESQNELLHGLVIVICNEDFYRVQADPRKYQASIKYFQIEITDTYQLKTPIIIPFHYEGYVAIYRDGKLLAEGKSKHLFDNECCYNNLLVIDKILLKDKQLLAADEQAQKKPRLEAKEFPAPPTRSMTNNLKN